MIALGLIFFKQVASEVECTSDDSIVITSALAVLFKDGSISSFSITQSTPLLLCLFFDDFFWTKKGERLFLLVRILWSFSQHQNHYCAYYGYCKNDCRYRWDEVCVSYRCYLYWDFSGCWLRSLFHVYISLCK